MIIERIFGNKKEDPKDLIEKKLFYIYSNLPLDPNKHVDGPSSGQVNNYEELALPASDMGFLSLNGEVKEPVFVQVLTGGEESWIGVAANGRRLKYVYKRDGFAVSYEARQKGEWKTLGSLEVTDQELFEDLIQNVGAIFDIDVS